jgi:hypothetical protein
MLTLLCTRYSYDCYIMRVWDEFSTVGMAGMEANMSKMDRNMLLMLGHNLEIQ